MIMRFYPTQTAAAILLLKKGITANDTEILRLKGLVRAITQVAFKGKTGFYKKIIFLYAHAHIEIERKTRIIVAFKGNE